MTDALLKSEALCLNEMGQLLSGAIARKRETLTVNQALAFHLHRDPVAHALLSAFS